MESTHFIWTVSVLHICAYFLQINFFTYSDYIFFFAIKVYTSLLFFVIYILRQGLTT